MNEGLQSAVKEAGGLRPLARLLGIRYQAIQQWHRKNRIPADRIVQIEKVTGIARERLRPDLYAKKVKAKKKGRG